MQKNDTTAPETKDAHKTQDVRALAAKPYEGIAEVSSVASRGLALGLPTFFLTRKLVEQFEPQRALFSSDIQKNFLAYAATAFVSILGAYAASRETIKGKKQVHDLQDALRTEHDVLLATQAQNAALKKELAEQLEGKGALHEVPLEAKPLLEKSPVTDAPEPEKTHEPEVVEVDSQDAVPDSTVQTHNLTHDTAAEAKLALS